MSILSRIIHTLGFAPDEDINEVESPDTPVQSEPAVAPPSAPASVTSGTETSTDTSTVAASVFNAVVKYFNDAMPDFVSRHLDTAAQREYLLQAIDGDIRQMLADTAAKAAKAAADMDAAERQKLNESMSELRKQCRQLEEMRDKLKNDQLSSTRQKRALNDRVHDLETQLENMSAEREQLTLENRSMANRLRVMGVTGAKGDDSLAEELAKAHAELEQLRQQAASTPQPDDKAERTIATLNNKLASMESNYNRCQVELANVRKQLDRMDDKNDELRRKLAEIQANPPVDESAAKKLEDANKRIRELEETVATEQARQASLLEEFNSRPEDTDNRNRRKRGRPRKSDSKATSSAEGSATPHISAVDELIDNTEWLVSPTVEQTKALIPEPDDSDFGFKPPVRKSYPDDDKQLSLF